MRNKFIQSPTRQFLVIIFLIISLPLLVVTVQWAVNLIGRASGTNANLVINYNSNQGTFPTPWKALAQGGEETGDMLSPAVSAVKALGPRYIRIDHLYDLYNVVSRTDGRIAYDFSSLDRTVDNILQTGALPFFSLSYMPPALSSGDVTEKPLNWQEWSDLVRATVERYSGRSGKNLVGVYYEVWNEPDLFGRWTVNGPKSYLELYYSSVLGAQTARNVNTFKIGGPATTGMYPNWIKGLIAYSQKNNLRLDFVSYHRYTKEIKNFSSDWKSLQETLDGYPNYKNLEVVISEWGSDPQNSPDHDGVFDAIHTISAVRQIIDRVSWAFSFEIKDGPADQEYWGRWGILTHEKFNLNKKPRYYALQFLNNLEGDRLSVSGEGTWVSALAAKNGDNTNIILVNYDPYGTHRENVPLFINNLPNANYLYKTSLLFGKSSEEQLRVSGGVLQKSISLPAQSAILIELTKLAPEHTFVLGFFGESTNRGLSLTPGDLPYKLDRKNLVFPQQGGMDFFIKPLWNSDQDDITLLSLPLDGGRELNLKKEKRGFGDRLSWGVYSTELALNTVTGSIDWQKGQWYHIGLSWSKDGLSVFIDGKKVQENQIGLNFNLAGPLTFHNFGGVIDELRIAGSPFRELSVPTAPYSPSSNTLFLRHLDGSTDK